MNEREFKLNLTAAEAFQKMSDVPAENAFWGGYLRGIRRNYHGENFGTDETHYRHMGLCDAPDAEHQLRGVGYKAGFEGLNARQALELLTTQERAQYQCTRCGHTWIPRQTEPPKHCPSCKSPYWDRPRREKKEGK